MPDEIKQRLQDSTEKCAGAYETWRKDEKNAAAREALQEAVHEVRKVASRLEIELVTSERDHTRPKPMKAPAHRNAQTPPQAREAPHGHDRGEREKSFEKLKKPSAEKKPPEKSLEKSGEK